MAAGRPPAGRREAQRGDQSQEEGCEALAHGLTIMYVRLAFNHPLVPVANRLIYSTTIGRTPVHAGIRQTKFVRFLGAVGEQFPDPGYALRLSLKGLAVGVTCHAHTIPGGTRRLGAGVKNRSGDRDLIILVNTV